MTFFKIRNSGRLNHTTAIMNASHVPIGIHFKIRACIIGIMLVAFAYIGIPSITAIGTAKGLFFVIYFSKNQVGTNPCINHQRATHKSTYGIIFHIRTKLSLLTCFMNFFHLISSFSISFGIQLFFQMKSATSHSILNFHIMKPQIIQRSIQENT